MSITLLANENFPAPAIRKLRDAGMDVVAVSEALPAVSDKEVLEFARREQRWSYCPRQCAQIYSGHGKGDGEISAPSAPIPGAAAVVGDSDDADRVVSQMVNQGIRKTMRGKHPGFMQTGFAQFRESGQQIHRPLNLVEKIIRRDECPFADIPFDSGVGIGVSPCG